jgi:acyl-CoA synthetase (AMP-forming)/AMP-acid ligase II
MLGAGIINPLNLRLSGQELQHILADSGATVAFVDEWFADHFARNIAPVRGELPLRHVVLMGDGDVPHDIGYESLLEIGSPTTPAEPDEADPVVLMYTGGTTGVAKGVLLDQRAEILNFYHIAMAVELSDRRVYLHQTPMFHAASMGGTIGIPAIGGTSVIVPMFEPSQVMDAIERHTVDWTVMVPTMIAMTINHPDFLPARLSSLRDLVYGGSPMPAGLLDRLFELLPDINLWQGYGMTECSSVLTMLGPDDHRQRGHVARSAGRPVMGVEVSIRAEDGTLRAAGENGEVCARGGNFMRGYWNRPEDTAETMREGWYHTGDEGHLDDEGYLYLVDRVKDMIVTGGENVYSIEVENAISTIPGVAEVAVIGIPHAVLGEQVHAIVVREPGSDLSAHDIQAYTRGLIAGYKVPKSVEFRAEPLPLSGALKPLKRELRKPYWEDASVFVN